MIETPAAPVSALVAGATPVRRALRIVLAVLCGMLAGVLTTSALWRGVQYAFPAEHPQETWGLFVWGEHFIWRFIVAVIAASAGSYVIGLIARHCGGTLAVIGILPVSLAWVTLGAWNCIAPLFPHEARFGTASLAVRISALALTLLLPATAYVIGREAAGQGAALASHFDTRAHTLLGIRWYHYLWLWLPIHIAVSQTAWVVVRFSDLIKAAWLDDGVLSIIPTLFVVGVLLSLQVTIAGARHAYNLLAGFENSPYFARDVLKFAFGYPLLAAAIQAGLSFADLALTRLILHFLK